MLVTGGMGFIGSAFIRYVLLEKNLTAPLVNLDIMSYAANPENVKDVSGNPNYHFVQGAIQDGNLLERLYAEFAFSTIVHFAAETHVDNSIVNPRSFVDTNILGTFELLEFVRRHPTVRLHIISTDEVYGSLSLEGVFTEESPFRPNSPYSASKAAADHLARAYYQTYKLPITISHASNNYGRGQHSEKLIPKIIANLEDKKPLPVYGLGHNVRDWLYVEDHAEAIYLLLQNAKMGSSYNVGGDNEWRNIDLIHLLIELFAEMRNKDPHELTNLIQFVSDRPGHDLRYALSNAKMVNDFSWTPHHSMIEGLRKTLNWYLNEKRTNLMCNSSTFEIHSLSS